MMNFNLTPEHCFFNFFRVYKLDVKKLTPKEHLIYCECRDAQSWKEWNNEQRVRKKEQLARIFNKLGQPNPVYTLEKYINFLERGEVKANLVVVYKRSIVNK